MIDLKNPPMLIDNVDLKEAFGEKRALKTIIVYEQRGMFPKGFYVTQKRRVWFFDEVMDYYQNLAENPDEIIAAQRARNKRAARASVEARRKSGLLPTKEPRKAEQAA